MSTWPSDFNGIEEIFTSAPGDPLLALNEVLDRFATLEPKQAETGQATLLRRPEDWETVEVSGILKSPHQTVVELGGVNTPYHLPGLKRIIRAEFVAKATTLFRRA